MTLKQPAHLAFAILASMMMSAAAFASANVDCGIDDRFIKFEMEAIAGRTGPINQVNVGIIDIKPAAVALTAPHITFDRTHIVQQWILGDELQLQVETRDDDARQDVTLVIVARLNRKTDKFSGRYVLKVSRAGETKEFKGRIKECVAG